MATPQQPDRPPIDRLSPRPKSSEPITVNWDAGTLLAIIALALFVPLLLTGFLAH
jgi:hypothetical protein